MVDRNIGINTFSLILDNKKNCTILEKHIYNSLEKDNKEVDIETYKWCIYQIVGMLFEYKSIKKVDQFIKDDKIGWNNPCYDNISEKINEFDEYLVKPFDVVDGIAECSKCGSKRTYSIQKQLRSGDEPMTTFTRCVICGNQWTYSG